MNKRAVQYVLPSDLIRMVKQEALDIEKRDDKKAVGQSEVVEAALRAYFERKEKGE